MIKKLNVFLTFNGDCSDALDFYSDVFDGEITERLTYGDAEMAENEADARLIMNSNIIIGGVQFSCFDSLEHNATTGNNTSFWLELDSEKALDNILEKFKERNMTILTKKEETFWSSVYTKVADQFGIIWELNYQK